MVPCGGGLRRVQQPGTRETQREAEGVRGVRLQERESPDRGKKEPGTRCVRGSNGSIGKEDGRMPEEGGVVVEVGAKWMLQRCVA